MRGWVLGLLVLVVGCSEGKQQASSKEQPRPPETERAPAPVERALGVLRSALWEAKLERAHPVALAALGARRPGEGVSMWRRMAAVQRSRGFGVATRLLWRALPQQERAELARLVRGERTAELRLVAVEAEALAGRTAEAARLLDGVKLGLGEAVALGVIAAAMKARGRTGWEALWARARFPEAPIATCYRTVLEALLQEKVEGLVGMLAEAGPGEPYARAHAIGAVLEQLARAGVAERYAAWLERAALAARDAATAFGLGAYAAGMGYPRAPGKALLELLAARWSEKLLRQDWGTSQAAAFLALRATSATAPELAKRIYRALVANVLGREDAHDYYHSVGTASAAIARIDPELALQTARQVRRLEWKVHARRGIYRYWAAANAEAALAHAAAIETKDRRMKADLRLEAAIGAAENQPERALAEVEQLPAHPDRYREGWTDALVALAGRGRSDEAIARLLNLWEGGKDPAAVAALAWILLPERMRRLIAGPRALFSDMNSQSYERWPGPYLTRSMRFAGMK